MPPERHVHGQQQAAQQPTEGDAMTMTPSMASLDAKFKLVAQRMKIIENNEQVIGRTLVAHNKKLKELEATLAAAGSGGKAPDITKLKDTLKEELKAEMMSSSFIAPPMEHETSSPRDSSELVNIKRAVELLRQQISELKYIVDSINPLEYVTLEQLNDVIERKIEKIKKA